MDERHLKSVYRFICELSEGNKDCKEWHEGRVVLAPKIETQAIQTNEEV